MKLKIRVYWIGTLAYKQGVTGSDLGFEKVVNYREVNGWLLGDWADKVEVFQSLPGLWLEQWVDQGVIG